VCKRTGYVELTRSVATQRSARDPKGAKTNARKFRNGNPIKINIRIANKYTDLSITSSSLALALSALINKRGNPFFANASFLPSAYTGLVRRRPLSYITNEHIYNNQPSFLRVQCFSGQDEDWGASRVSQQLALDSGQHPSRTERCVCMTTPIEQSFSSDCRPFRASTTFSHSINRALSGAPDESIPEDPRD
jgi:hypothetical protein